MKETLSYQAYLKSPYKSIKHSTYFAVYDDLFARYRGKEITFVEIGVLGGGSLFMWREFLGPKARIIGIDLNPNAKKWEAEGFDIFIGSQSDKQFWQDFVKKVGKVDVVLDDGGHTYEQQIITTEMLLDSINDQGMLVVEDTHTSYMDGFGSRRYSFIEYVKCLIDKMNQRFSELNTTASDRRVWSIQTYESFVAFHIRRSASDLVSESTDNGGTDDAAMDYRYFDHDAVKSIDGLARKFNFLKYIPGARWLGAKAKNYVIVQKSKRKLKKYFSSDS
ncbi:class I SAM-dependent methyltransferase [Gimesia algae]|uniref:Demethylmacrocin O-methyltransferase n=1 Tax=Gimesia algae TaxID=2527971 RepID=A0A517V633_9PLAN|nr:class I SAM-dependent methyltransferase [Gimesia algae]QDT88460.1 Demethylmacrocin O-methyltransferase [Gimesia algae]